MIPAYADRARWSKMMVASVQMAVTKFSAERMVRENFEKLYDKPAAKPALAAARA